MTNEELDKFHDLLWDLIDGLDLNAEELDMADRVALIATTLSAFAQRLMPVSTPYQDELNAYILTLLKAAVSPWPGPFKVEARILAPETSGDVPTPKKSTEIHVPFV